LAKYRILDPGAWLDFKEGGPRLVLPMTEVKLENGKTDQVPTVIDYSGWPNAAMEPVDDEAKASVEILAGLRARGVRLPRSPAEYRKELARVAKTGEVDLVEIPADWRTLRPELQINLARRLGCPIEAKHLEAFECIIREVLRRETKQQAVAA
jgi:hypothetical protein